MNLHRRALGRAGPGTFVATKVPKKACSRKASLRTPYPKSTARPLPCKTNRTTGCNYFAPIRPIPSFCKNLLCPCSRTFPTLFCPLSLEAAQLRKTSGFNYVMGRYEGSSAPCTTALYIEEDSSLSLRMTAAFKYVIRCSFLSINKSLLFFYLGCNLFKKRVVIVYKYATTGYLQR